MPKKRTSYRMHRHNNSKDKEMALLLEQIQMTRRKTMRTVLLTG